MAKTDISFTGNFSLEINSNSSEAVLVFDNGTEQDTIWNIADIIVLLQTNKIAGIKIDELTKTLASQNPKKEKGFRLTIAKGLEPVSPQPDVLQADELLIPEHLKDVINKTLSTADPPQIFREFHISVEKEKLVQKKGSLPFFQEKTEKITVTQKEVKQEKVYVDTICKQFAFVQENQPLGTIIPAKPGVPGKSVQGTVIPALAIDDPVFYCGANVTRKGNELIAQCTGIVRIGSSWIDIVPFTEHNWTLSQSDDKATCYLNFFPGSTLLPPIAAHVILEAAIKLGYPADDLLSASELDPFLIEAIDLGHEINHRSISQSQDALIDILVSDDKLKAVLNATKGSGSGKPLLLKDLGKAINESGLAFNKDKIKADIPAWFNSSEKSLIGYVLAEGKTPQTATVQSANFSVDFYEGKELAAIKSQFANTHLEHAESFPRDNISAIGKVEKEQRILTLGPITAGTPGMDVYGKSIPGKPGESFALQLYGNLELVGNNLVVAKKAGILLKAEKDGKTYLAGFEHMDAELYIELADNNLTAYITINAHRGTGKAMKRDDILAAISKAGVVKGIEREILEKIIASSENETDISRICFARGQVPNVGKPSEVHYLINFASGQNVTMRNDGTADFRNQDRITTIKKDTPIAEILPSDHQVTPGFDVCGKEIATSNQDAPPIEIGANVRQQSQENGVILLIADCDGELRHDNKRLEIAATYTLKGNVDATTGNIKFPGTVQVSGDIMSGFYIVSGGDIKIAGSVEGALLSSDQDILIQAGVKGAGKAVLRSKRGIMAGFIEQATILSVGDIKIKKALLRSRVKCNSRLVMADDGHIMGGEIKVKLGLITGDLGSASGSQTRVFFGQDILVEDQIEVEEKEILKLQDDVAKLNTAMKSSEKINNKDQLQELFNEKVKSMKMLEKRNLRIFTLKERFEQHFDSELIIKGTLYPGVIIESHGRTHEIIKPSKSVRIKFDTNSGRIIEEPLGSGA